MSVKQSEYIKYVLIFYKNGHHCVASADPSELRTVTKDMGAYEWRIKDLRVAKSEQQFMELLLQLSEDEEA